MDFITNLPKSVEYKKTLDEIPMVVNKPSKIGHYISCRSNMTTDDPAKVIIQEFIQLN